MTTININDRELSTKTVLEIGKFTILWNIFEKEKCRSNCNPNKLVKLTENVATNKLWQDLAHILRERTNLYSISTHSYVYNKLSLGNGTPNKEQIIEFIVSEGRKSLAGGLLAIYRIRNNMFHGLKTWTDLDNQIDLFIALNNFLTYAIREL